jgi:uncharacterized membrane protein YfcA
LGLLAGQVSAFLGLGGGMLMVPGMVHLLRIRQARATGTSLLAMLCSTSVTIYLYHRGALAHGEPLIQPMEVLSLSAGSFLGALLGFVLRAVVGGRKLMGGFWCAMLLLGAYLCVDAIRPLPQAVAAGEGTIETLKQFGLGLGVGASSSLVGVGGGLLMVPALVLLFGDSQRQAQATALAAIIPASIPGVIMRLRGGAVVWSLAMWLAIGAVFGSLIAVPRVFQLRQEVLQLVFGMSVVLGGMLMLSLQARTGRGEDRAGT